MHVVFELIYSKMLAVSLFPGLAVIRVQLNPELETRTLMIHFFLKTVFCGTKFQNSFYKSRIHLDNSYSITLL